MAKSREEKKEGNSPPGHPNPCRDLTPGQVRQLVNIAKAAEQFVKAYNFKKPFSEAFEDDLRAVTRVSKDWVEELLKEYFSTQPWSDEEVEMFMRSAPVHKMSRDQKAKLLRSLNNARKERLVEEGEDNG